MKSSDQVVNDTNDKRKNCQKYGIDFAARLSAAIHLRDFKN